MGRPISDTCVTLREAAGWIVAGRAKDSSVKGLVIDEPWLSLIVSGNKIWEMRSRPTSHRGRIALIQKGSGVVVGLADLVDCIGPLDAVAWRAHADKHCIPPDKQESTRPWTMAWVLEGAVALGEPVPYEHPNGAVVWVRLQDEVVAKIQASLSRPKIVLAGPEVAATTRLTLTSTFKSAVASANGTSDTTAPGTLGPVANDGT